MKIFAVLAVFVLLSVICGTSGLQCYSCSHFNACQNEHLVTCPDRNITGGLNETDEANKLSVIMRGVERRQRQIPPNVKKGFICEKTSAIDSKGKVVYLEKHCREVGMDEKLEDKCEFLKDAFVKGFTFKGNDTMELKEIFSVKGLTYCTCTKDGCDFSRAAIRSSVGVISVLCLLAICVMF